jgi:hypothetical protein
MSHSTIDCNRIWTIEFSSSYRARSLMPRYIIDTVREWLAGIVFHGLTGPSP